MGQNEYDAATRPRGRALKGERLLASVPHGHWKTTTFLAALRSTGLTAPLVVDGAINGELFLGWVRHHLVPTLKSGDVVVMGGAVVIMFFLPWLDNSPVKSIRYRPGWHKVVYGLFVTIFIVLGYFGVLAPSAAGQLFSMVGTLLYFGFFLLMPWWSAMGEFKTVPDRVTFEAH